MPLFWRQLLAALGESLSTHNHIICVYMAVSWLFKTFLLISDSFDVFRPPSHFENLVWWICMKKYSSCWKKITKNTSFFQQYVTTFTACHGVAKLSEIFKVGRKVLKNIYTIIQTHMIRFWIDGDAISRPGTL